MNETSNIYFVDVEPKGEPGSDLPQDMNALKVFQSWGLLPRTLERLVYCGIKGLDHLEHMTLADMEIIFNDDSQLGEKILFRKCLRRWKEHNGFEPLFPESAPPIPTLQQPQRHSSHRLSRRESSTESLNGRVTTPLKNKEFNLRELLRNSLKGIKLLSSYEKNCVLTNKEQCYLSQIIVDFHMTVQPKMSVEQMKYYVKEIIKHFPSEVEATYYVPRSKSATRAPQGKLYHRYLNVNAKYKKEAAKNRDSDSDFG